MDYQLFVEGSNNKICACHNERFAWILQGNCLLKYNRKSGELKCCLLSNKYAKKRKKGISVFLQDNRFYVFSECLPELMIIESDVNDIDNIKNFKLEIDDIDKNVYFCVPSGNEIFVVSTYGETIARLNKNGYISYYTGWKDRLREMLGIHEEILIKMRPYEAISIPEFLFMIAEIDFREYLIKFEGKTLRIISVIDISLSGGRHALGHHKDGLFIRNNQMVIKYDIRQNMIEDKWSLPDGFKEYCYLIGYENSLGVIGVNGNCGKLDLNTGEFTVIDLDGAIPIDISNYSKNGSLLFMKKNKVFEGSLYGIPKSKNYIQLKTELETFVKAI